MLQADDQALDPGVSAELWLRGAGQRTGSPGRSRSNGISDLGRNDLGQELYDPRTGGCGDGLQEDRINRNQGAESTLAFLLSLAEMNLLESSLAAFRQGR